MPLYNLLADFVPLAGSRRRSYLLLTTAVASISLTAVYLLPVGLWSHEWEPLTPL